MDYKKLISVLALFLLSVSGRWLYAQSSGFAQFMGINLRVDEPSLGKAQCASHAREFHDWVCDQGKRTQDPNSRATADFIIKPGDYLLHFIDLYDVADINFNTVVATYDVDNSAYSDLVASETYNVYRANDYDWIFSPTDPNDLLYHHYRVICTGPLNNQTRLQIKNCNFRHGKEKMEQRRQARHSQGSL